MTRNWAVLIGMICLSSTSTLAPLSLLWLSSPALAQATTPRQTQADQLLQQGTEQYKAKQYDIAIQSWQQALIRYRQLSDRQGEGATLYRLGMAYRELEQYDQAIDYLTQSLTLNRELQDRSAEARTLYQLGRLYRLTRNYDQASQMLNQALAHLRGIKNRDGENSTLYELGLTYRDLKQYDLALQVLEQSLAIDREQQNLNNERLTLETIAQVYEQMGQADKAVTTRHQATAIAQTLASPSMSASHKVEANRLLNQGIEQYKTSQFEAALQSWQQALILYQQIKDRWGEGNALGNLGVAYYSLGNYPQAIEYQEQSEVDPLNWTT